MAHQNAAPGVVDGRSFLPLLTAPDILDLQRIVGNRAVARAIATREHDRRRVGDKAADHQVARVPVSAVAGEGGRAPRLEHANTPSTRSPKANQKHGAAKSTKDNARATAVQRRSTQHSLAKVTNVGVKAGDAVGGKGQLGHAMDIWIDIDCGKHPTTPVDARPNSIYGLTLEYWEHVNVPHDNKGGTGEKPWNDIYGMKSDASTFDTAAPGCAMTWKAAVDAATAGTLTGKKRIGFRDLPGLFQMPGRNVERTLDFRIVVADGNSRQEIYATQLLRMVGGKLKYSAYKDSKGTIVESHGFGGDNYAPNSQAEKQALLTEPGRLTTAALPTIASITGGIPDEAKQELLPFVTAILQSQAEAYIDKEMAAFVGLVDQERQGQGAEDFKTMFANYLLGDVPGGVAAGQFLVPSISGTQRFERPLSNGGLLVALATKNNVLRMYYTSNTTKSVSLDLIPQLAAKHWTLPLRSFAEVPVETVGSHVESIKAVAAQSKLVGKPVTGGPTHLRAFARQGSGYIVNVGKQIGPRLKEGSDVSIYDPEVRDISGDWLKGKAGTKTGFLRAEKVTGARNKGGWAREQKGQHDEIGGKAAMEKFFAKHFRDNGGGYQVYAQLLTQYAGMAGEIEGAYKAVFGNDLLLKVKLDLETSGHQTEMAFMQSDARLWSGDRPNFVQAIMDYVKAKRGEGDKLEATYNQHVGTMGLDVPVTMGEIVHAYFMKVFKAQGPGHVVYTQLAADFPDFTYRLKPAYRAIHGEDQLKQMLEDQEQAEFSKDVPKPNSLENLLSWFEFAEHQPFILKDFAPSTGGGSSAKFDVKYDPKTGALDMTVKVAFRFKDREDIKPVGDLSGESPQFGPEFGRNKWTDPEKADWIRDYKIQATAPFNSKGTKIACKKPGWDVISVTPKFQVESVAMGQQHFVIDVDKAVLTETGPGQKKIQSSGVSGAGKTMIDNVNVPSVILQQQDIYDKFKDPRLHTYLHAVETSTNVQPAYLLDRRRLESVLSELGTFEMGGGPSSTQARHLADALNRLGIASSLSSLHPLLVTGFSHVSEDRALRAARSIKNSLLRKGVANPIDTGKDAADHKRAVVSAKPVDPAIQSTYVANWTRLTAAHEFGHMIGLIDEYYGAASGETIKEMISAGWLPPDTRSDHLKLHPPKNPDEKDKQEAMMVFLRKTKQESPDFAMDAPGGSLPKTTSLMTGGFETSGVHFISAWEALTTMTAPYIAEKFWKIT